MACPYFRVARPPLTYPRKAMAAGCGSSPALLFPPGSFLLVCFGLGHCVRALPRKLLLLLLQRGTEPGRLGPGGRCWRPAVAIRWGSYFRKWALLGYFFLAWSDSMESVPPISCWKELWPPAYWEVSGRKWPGMSHIQCGHFCSSPVCCTVLLCSTGPGVPARHPTLPSPTERTPSSWLCWGGAARTAQSQGGDLGSCLFLN